MFGERVCYKRAKINEIAEIEKLRSEFDEESLEVKN